MYRIITTAAVAFSVLFTYCSGDKTAPKKADLPVQFSSLPSSATNILFKNTITENDTINLINNAYTYMGSGVGIGDFNNDGLPDIFFCSKPAYIKTIYQ